MKRCAAPDCDWSFTPSKHNPYQKFCGREECKRYRDAQRQKRHYHENINNPRWACQHLERKKRERACRMERQKRHSDNTDRQSAQPSAALNNTLTQLLAGVVCMVSGAEDVESVQSILRQCIRKGSEVYPEGIPL